MRVLIKAARSTRKTLETVLPPGCIINIAKGTTDPRVEFILPK